MIFGCIKFYDLIKTITEFFLGFLAYKTLGVNPFNAGELTEYFSALDIDKAVAVVEAGLENATQKLELANNSMTAEELTVQLDPMSFAAIVSLIKEAAGDDGEPDEEEDPDAEDPTKPQAGSPSGQSAVAASD